MTMCIPKSVPLKTKISVMPLEKAAKMHAVPTMTKDEMTRYLSCTFASFPMKKSVNALLHATETIGKPRAKCKNINSLPMFMSKSSFL
mmetsp:Transcript_9453/g.14340  ORF Transcript_9453/g.14340 Transcript_9453/m.14340 type:complete len:88 (+) Transcript_9453:200-463(+)